MDEEMNLRLVILADNSARSDLIPCHGMSFLIELDGYRVLWDTGPNSCAYLNAQAMGIPLDHLDAIALSHGHWDHGNGLREILGINSGIPFYHSPFIFRRRWSFKSGREPREIGLDPDVIDLIKNSGQSQWVMTPTELFPNLWMIGSIPRISGKDSGGEFYLDAQGQELDQVPDDQSLAILSPKGLIVILGCCHAGFSNTIQHWQSHFKSTRIYAVLGGFHLGERNQFRREKALSELELIKPERIVPCHCTGEEATVEMEEKFGSGCVRGYAGMEWVL